EAGGQPGPALRGSLPVRGGGRVEPSGAGQPRHGPADPDGAARRPGTGDTADLDGRGGRVPRRVRRLRPALVLAQAGPAAASTGAGGRQRPRGRGPGAVLRGRVVPAVRSPQGRG